MDLIFNLAGYDVNSCINVLSTPPTCEGVHVDHLHHPAEMPTILDNLLSIRRASITISSTTAQVVCVGFYHLCHKA